LRAIVKERKTHRPKVEKLSDREIKEKLRDAEKLYILGINSAYVEQARKAVEARFGKSPKIVIGEPISSPALRMKMSAPSRSTRLANIRMQFSVV